MSTYDPSGTEPEEGGKPSSGKQPPPTGGTPGAPSDPYGTPAQPPPSDPYGTPPSSPTPPPGGNPYGSPGSYGGTYGGAPYDQSPPGQAPGQGFGPAHGQGMPGAGPVPGMPPIGSWPNRILARLLDYVMIQIVAILLVLPFASLGDRTGSTGAFWLACVLYFIYEGTMLSRDGQTLGKKAMKVRVAMLVDGNTPTGSAAWTRAAVFIVPAIVCCAALWWIIDGLFGVFDKPYRQCLHDKAAKTVVVSTA